MKSRNEEEIEESAIRALWSSVIARAMLDLACSSSLHKEAHEKIRWDCANFLFDRWRNLRDVLDAAGASYGKYAGMMNEILRTAKEIVERWREEGREGTVIWKQATARREMSRLGVSTSVPKWFRAGEAMILNLAQAMKDRGEMIDPLPSASEYKPLSTPPTTTKNGYVHLLHISASPGRPRTASGRPHTTTKRRSGRRRDTVPLQ